MARDKKGAQKRTAKLAFLDESGFSLRPSVRRTWAPVGQTPVLSTHFHWERLNVIGTLVCRPDGSEADLLLSMQPDSVTGETILDYLRSLHRHVEGPIVLLWDHLTAHHRREVSAYLAENTSWLTVEWMPTYAPELNPVEYVWSSAKASPTANSRPDTLDEIERSLKRFRKRVASDRELLKGYLTASGLFQEQDDGSLV